MEKILKTKSDTSCKTSRWRSLKGKLNNLSSESFYTKYLNTPEAILIDVRTQEEFLYNHMPKAVNIDYLADDFYNQLEKLSKDKSYFVYCRSGRRSIRVCTLMRNGGFNQNTIYNLDLGYTDWSTLFPDGHSS